MSAAVALPFPFETVFGTIRRNLTPCLRPVVFVGKTALFNELLTILMMLCSGTTEILMSASSTVAAIHTKQSKSATKVSKAVSTNANTTGFHAALAKVSTAVTTAGTTKTSATSKAAKVETGFGNKASSATFVATGKSGRII
jgi:hypothetical protein